MSRLAAAYSNWLTSSPIISRCVSAGFVVSGGDLLSQIWFEGRGFSKEKQGINWTRVAKAYLIGVGVITPNLYIWYNKLLPRIMSTPLMINRSPMAKTVVGTLLDQGLFSWSIIGQFFFFSSLLANGDIEQATQNVLNNIWPAMKANWTAWPIITFLNLKFVPVMYQVIVVNFCALFWNLYLAKQNQDNLKKRLAAKAA